MAIWTSRGAIGLGLALTTLTIVGCGAEAGAGAGTTGDAPKPMAKKAGFTDIVLTDDENAKVPKTSFGKDTPKIWVFYGLENVPVGDVVKGVWVCEESAGVAPNFEIDKAALELGIGVNVGNFSLSKPTKGWPVGKYRVDLYWNDKVADSVKFTIK